MSNFHAQDEVWLGLVSGFRHGQSKSKPPHNQAIAPHARGPVGPKHHGDLTTAILSLACGLFCEACSATLRMMLPDDGRHNADMTWKTIRLELARTARFPEGSAAHAYVLRLPVDDNGMVETRPLRDATQQPVVRRFWPDEPDQTGVVIKQGRRWTFSYRPGAADDEAIFHLEDHPVRVGDYLTITETDGQTLPFRVVSCHV